MRFTELVDANLAWTDNSMIRVFDTENIHPDLTPISVRAAKVVYQDLVVFFFSGDLVVGSMG